MTRQAHSAGAQRGGGRLPAEVRRRAEAGLRALVLPWPGVTGVSWGIKRKRRRGHGPRAVPCLKVFVVRKIGRPARDRCVPPAIRVRWRGRSWRVPTDVEPTGRAHLHVAPVEHHRAASRLVPPGSPGAVVRAQGTDHLLTAGHALRRVGVAQATAADPFDLRGAGRIGQVVGGVSDRQTADGRLDFGLVRLEQALAALRALLPGGIARIVPLSDLEQQNPDAAPLTYEVRSWQHTVSAELSAVVRDRPQRFDFGTHVEYYAPALLQSLAYDGRFRSGDSGAPLVTADGGLVGIHVIGMGSQGRVGWAVAADTILRSCREQLDPTAAIVPL